MILIPDLISPDNTYIEYRVRNIGTTATTITNCCCHFYDSWFAKMRHRPSKNMVVNRPNDIQPLPHKLDVGEEWTGLALQHKEIDALIETGNLWGAVYHSWSDKPIEVKIRPSVSSTEDKNDRGNA